MIDTDFDSAPVREDTDYNKIVPLRYRMRLNAQKVRLKIGQKVTRQGTDVNIYRYVIGLGEKHFKEFDRRIIDIIKLFPWAKKKHLRFVINELILNTQFSMLREVVNRIQANKKISGYFYLTLHINDDFASVGIEEFGDFFDYYSYLELQDNFDLFHADQEAFYDESSELRVTGLNDLSRNSLKLILNEDHQLIIPDQSNKIALYIVEHATNHDFYISSFYKNGIYMWKRIHFRIENGQ